MQQQRHQMDYVLFFTLLILCGVGVVTVYSASTILALQSDPPKPASYFAVKQLEWAVLGIITMVGVGFLPHRVWYKYAVPFLGFSLMLLVAVLIPGIGTSANGGRRWIGHGGFHIQPSEIAMVAIIMYLAFFFTKKVALVHNFKRGLLPGLIAAAFAFGLIMLEPDMGTGMTLVAACLVVVFASGARLKPLFIMAGAILPLVIGLAFMESYRSDRIKAWLDPFHHAGAESYQLLHGLTAISAGGWFGRGFDMSVEKLGYLPFPYTDFIFTVFVEEWGFVGAVALLCTFGVLIWRGFHTARRAPDRFSALVAIGLTGMITFKSIINLGAVTGLLPVTGIPLPFISYGGTSLVVNMFAMGILLSISRYTLDEEPEYDQLADIITVDDFEQLRVRRIAPDKERPQPQVAHPRGRTNVHFLSRHGRQNSSSDSWRTRQETASSTSVKPASRTSRESRESRRQTSSSTSMTWRERNDAGRGKNSNKNDHSKKRGSLFRKDR